MSEAAKKEEIIELDDPSLQEAQQYDPEADKDLYVPPPEKDEEGNQITYLFKLSLGKNKFEKYGTYFKKDKNDKPMGIMMVDLVVVQPGGAFDKFKIGAEYLNTYVDRRSGASGFTNIARLLGEPMPKGLGVKDQAELLEPMIKGEPVLPGRIQWSAYCTGCEEDKDQFRGENKWPEKLDDQGRVIGHIPLVACPDCGTDLTPKVSLKRFVASAE